ncbi:hypothetical protein ACQUSR_33420 [Streptomyces sp. P1-3]|uniref:hypothetical protein n=1 Tax=Streptomyces sp. P1-3 TaxID=3421658 RepID=UPI003D367523
MSQSAVRPQMPHSAVILGRQFWQRGPSGSRFATGAVVDEQAKAVQDFGDPHDGKPPDTQGREELGVSDRLAFAEAGQHDDQGSVHVASDPAAPAAGLSQRPSGLPGPDQPGIGQVGVEFPVEPVEVPSDGKQRQLRRCRGHAMRFGKWLWLQQASPGLADPRPAVLGPLEVREEQLLAGHLP